jgi:ABC-type branched-subunit amino acid transport system ATPase component
MTTACLHLAAVSRDFAGVHALRAVSLRINPGELVALLGPNGSGKTTLVNVASGVVGPSSGRVAVDGRDLTGAPPRRFAAAGVVRTFQGLRLFEGMSVRDNVVVGAQRGVRPSLVEAWLRKPGFRRRERALALAATAALAAVGMDDHASASVGGLSHGQRRRVEIARAIAARPAYLVLDEPSAGVDPSQVESLAAVISSERERGAGVLLVEHDLDLVGMLADRAVGLDAGTIVAEGGVADVAAALGVKAGESG